MDAVPAFALTQRSARLQVGSGAMESGVRHAMARTRARRIGIVTSGSLVTTTVARVIELLGDCYSGVTVTISRDAEYENVDAATRLLRPAAPDLLIAVGGGSVLVGARAIAIFLGEAASPFELMTTYDGPVPRSPRLEAPKVPILNIPVTPTTAMNRSGTGLRNDSLPHRMEYFDPKTRPIAVVLDPEVLVATPDPIFRHAGATVLARTFGDAAEATDNPLDDADRNLALGMAMAGFSGDLTPARRIELCLAAFLQTRIEDSRGRLRPRSCFAGDYALATALHLGAPGVSQGAATTALFGTMTARDTPQWKDEARRLHRVFGLEDGTLTDDEVHARCCEVILACFADAGMPTQVRDLGVPAEALENIARQSMLNFNQLSAEAGVRDVEKVLASLRASW